MSIKLANFITVNSSTVLHTTASSSLGPVHSAVLRTVLYFDLFNHPLKSNEIRDFCQQAAATRDEINTAIHDLCSAKLLGELEGFYFIAGRELLTGIRKERNARAEKYMAKARRYSRLISRFPFVRGVAISGSLSKGTVDRDGDVDYFIITEPKRLWICRTLLIFFKKTFLLNSRKYFCVNYFIDTHDLLIPDMNLFTATEIAFVHPMFGGGCFERFRDSNEWVNDFYPNRPNEDNRNILHAESGIFKRVMEKSLGGKLGEKLDVYFFHLTLKRWKKKFGNVDESQFDLNFRSRRNVSKHHPQGFQYKVMNRLSERIAEFESQHGISILRKPWRIGPDGERKS